MNEVSNNKYTEIFDLKKMLDEAQIPYQIHHIFEGYRIAYLSIQSVICSVIEHNYSIGSANDLLEIRGLLTEEEYKEDDVKGYLTAEEVFERIKANYTQNV